MYWCIEKRELDYKRAFKTEADVSVQKTAVVSNKCATVCYISSL